VLPVLERAPVGKNRDSGMYVIWLGGRPDVGYSVSLGQGTISKPSSEGIRKIQAQVNGSGWQTKSFAGKSMQDRESYTMAAGLFRGRPQRE
jgi:hypothetical protein